MTIVFLSKIAPLLSKQFKEMFNLVRKEHQVPSRIHDQGSVDLRRTFHILPKGGTFVWNFRDLPSTCGNLGLQVDADGRKFPRNVGEDRPHRERPHRERPHCVSPLFTFVFMFQYWHLSVNACFVFFASVSFTEGWTANSFQGISVRQHLHIALDQSVSLSNRNWNFPPLHVTLIIGEC